MKTKAALIKEAYPDINWDRFEDIDRALNFDLWYGTAHEYFGGDSPAEELEHYEWQGFIQAEKDIREILEPIPHQMYYDEDGGENVTTDDPEQYEGYWVYRCATCDEWHYGDDIPDGHFIDENCIGEWSGGEWTIIDPRKELMFDETWKQVF